MTNYELPNVQTTIDGATTVLISILTCYFVDWVRKGRQSQQDVLHHAEQLSLLRRLEKNISRLAPVAGRYPTPLLNDEERKRIDKYSRVRIDLDDMFESCKKLQDTHQNFKAHMQRELDDANAMNKKLRQDLVATRTKVKLSEKEMTMVKEQMAQSTKDVTSELETLQSQHDKTVHELTVAKARVKDIEQVLESNNPENDATTELKTYQTRYLQAVQDRDDAKAKVETEKKERAESERRYNDMMSELKTYIEGKNKDCEELDVECTNLREEVKELEAKMTDMKDKIKVNTEAAATIQTLQGELSKLEDDNSKLVEDIRAAEKTNTKLKAQKNAPRGARSAPTNESRRNSLLSPDSERSRLEFEEMLAQTENKIREMQQGEPSASSPSKDSLSEKLRSTSSGKASSDRSSNRSSLSKPPMDTSTIDNMDLYESPSASALTTQKVPGNQPKSPIARSDSKQLSSSTGSRPASSSGQPSPSSPRRKSLFSLPDFSSNLSMDFAMGHLPSPSPSLTAGGSPSLTSGGSSSALPPNAQFHCAACDKDVPPGKQKDHASNCLSRKCPYCQEPITLEDYRSKTHVKTNCKYTQEEQTKMNQDDGLVY